MLFARTSTRSHVMIYLTLSSTSGVFLVVGLLMVWCGVAPTLVHPWETALFVIAQVVVVAILYTPVVLNLAILLWLTRTKAGIPCVISTVAECANVGALIMHGYSAISDSIHCEGSESFCNYEYVFCAGIMLCLACCTTNSIVSVILLSKTLAHLGMGRMYDHHTLVFSRPAPMPMPPPSPRPLYSGGSTRYVRDNGASDRGRGDSNNTDASYSEGG